MLPAQFNYFVAKKCNDTNMISHSGSNFKLSNLPDYCIGWFFKPMNGTVKKQYHMIVSKYTIIFILLLYYCAMYNGKRQNFLPLCLLWSITYQYIFCLNLFCQFNKSLGLKLFDCGRWSLLFVMNGRNTRTYVFLTGFYINWQLKMNKMVLS